MKSPVLGYGANIIPLSPRTLVAPDSSPARLLVVAEGTTAHRAVLAELAGAGWIVGGPAASNGVRTLSLGGAADAETIMLAALRGEALLIVTPDRDEMAGALVDTVDDMLDDLASLGSVWHVDASSAVEIDPDGWRLAHELAAGSTLEAAAVLHHLSSRTAHRRVVAARQALGAESRAQLVRALSASDRIPSANNG